MNLSPLKPIASVIARRFKARHIPTPMAINIKPVRKDFTYAADMPRYYYDNNPLLTHSMNAMSLTFPEGEQFFVDSVRALREHFTDERQRQHIRGFIGQEAMHSLEHSHFNEFLKTQGYEKQVEGGTKLSVQMIARFKKGKTPVQNLAATAALEHITSVFGSWLMTDESIERYHPSVRPLWLWHGIEETEHKAVAFDLLQNVTGGDYFTRVKALPPILAELTLYWATYTFEFLKADGLQYQPSVYLRGFREFFRAKGMGTMLLPALIKYFDPAFHPWEFDDSEQVAIVKQRLLQVEAEADARQMAKAA